ncbi:Uncharacterised protein [Vibrio cholerae]|nr:Uncharacterised protein [Vibrio cholerae]
MRDDAQDHAGYRRCRTAMAKDDSALWAVVKRQSRRRLVRQVSIMLG